jgi:hypothetical protein
MDRHDQELLDKAMRRLGSPEMTARNVFSTDQGGGKRRLVFGSLEVL